MTAHRCMALRDFFLAATGEDLRAAYERLRPHARATLPPVRDAAEWREIEYVFNRLFVGPKALAAPPYASVYLDAEPLLMGPSTMRARHVYEMLGLRSPGPGVPDDHVGLELDAAAAMSIALAEHSRPELQELWRFFVREHLDLWLRAFHDRVLQAAEKGEGHAAITAATRELLHWLEDASAEASDDAIAPA